MRCEGVDGVVGGANDLDLEFFQNARGRKIRLGELAVRFVPDFARGVGRDQAIDAEVAFQFEMAPMVKRISQRVWHGLAPREKFFIGLGFARAKFFRNSIAAHRAPFVVVAFQPDLGQVGKAPVASKVLGRKVAVVIDDRQLLRHLMIKSTCRRTLEQEILVDEVHVNGGIFWLVFTKGQRTTRALPPFMSFSTSLRVAIDVSPGVVDASAP